MFDIFRNFSPIARSLGLRAILITIFGLKESNRFTASACISGSISDMLSNISEIFQADSPPLTICLLKILFTDLYFFNPTCNNLNIEFFKKAYAFSIDVISGIATIIPKELIINKSIVLYADPAPRSIII